MVHIKRIVNMCFMILFTAAYFTSCNNASSQDLDSWVGYYGWSDSVPGVTSGSTPLWEEVVISIYKENEKYYATYIRNGYMRGEIAKAEVLGNKEQITLIFMEHIPDSYQKIFQKGDELCALKKDGDIIITKWITDEPNFEGNSHGLEDVYFTQDDEEYYKEIIDLFT